MATETGRPIGDIAPAVAYAFALERASDEELAGLTTEQIVPDPDNPVATKDPWLAKRERILHEKLEERKRARAEAAKAAAEGTGQ